MDLLLVPLQRIADVGWTWLWHATWQGSLLAGCLMALVLLRPRWPAPLRYGLLVLALLKFAVPPVLSAPTGIFSWLGQNAEWMEAFDAGRIATPAWQVTVAEPGLTGLAAEQPAELLTAPPGDPRWTWSSCWLVLQVVGMLGMIGWILSQQMALRRVAARARQVDSGPIYRSLTRLSSALGLRRPPVLLVSSELHSPMAFGLRRAQVMVPEAMLESLSGEESRIILAHELAHHRRGDLWLNSLQVLLSVLWWFNPVYHGLSRLLRKVREECCDDLILATGLATEKGYCSALLNSAELLRDPVPVGQALGFADRLHPLGRRLARIMDRTLARSRRLSMVGATAIAVLACLLLPGTIIGDEQDRELLQLRSEERSLRGQVQALSWLQFRQAWPAYAARQIERALPERFGMDQWHLSDRELLLEGRADDLEQVAALVERLTAVPLFDQVEARSIRRRQDDGRYEVQLAMEGSPAIGGSAPAFEASEADEEALRQSLARLAAGKDRADERFVSRQEMREVLQSLRRLIEAANLETLSMAPGPQQTHGSYAVWPISLSLVGTDRQLDQLIRRLAQAPVAWVVDRWQIEPSSTERVQAQITLQLMLELDGPVQLEDLPVPAFSLEQLQTGLQHVASTLKG